MARDFSHEVQKPISLALRLLFAGLGAVFAALALLALSMAATIVFSLMTGGRNLCWGLSARRWGWRCGVSRRAMCPASSQVGRNNQRALRRMQTGTPPLSIT